MKLPAGCSTAPGSRHSTVCKIVPINDFRECVDARTLPCEVAMRDLGLTRSLQPGRHGRQVFAFPRTCR